MMHALEMVHRLLSPVMHLKRLVTLKLLLQGLIHDKKLSVTQLGRSLLTSAQEKNNIKRSDRFLGNAHVWKERYSMYKVLSESVLGANKRPLIIVDWSHIPNTSTHVLRAAFAKRGRALTLYEEVFPKRLENNPQVHRRFLKKLKNLLPSDCIPIVITDALFSTPWFQSVQEMGWDYVGRIRGNKCFKMDGESELWHLYTCYRTLITSPHAPEYLGEGLLTKETSFKTHFYLTKMPKKYRVFFNKLKKKRQHSHDMEHSTAAKEPWLLASSLKKRAETIIKLYYCRMEIEEGFRDLKSSQFGLSFEHARSYKIRRIQVLLMISMLAAYLMFLIGWIAEALQWHHQFQANTNKKRRVLSLVYLGARVIKKKLPISPSAFLLALHEIQNLHFENSENL